MKLHFAGQGIHPPTTASAPADRPRLPVSPRHSLLRGALVFLLSLIACVAAAGAWLGRDVPGLEALL